MNILLFISYTLHEKEVCSEVTDLFQSHHFRPTTSSPSPRGPVSQWPQYRLKAYRNTSSLPGSTWLCCHKTYRRRQLCWEQMLRWWEKALFQVKTNSFLWIPNCSPFLVFPNTLGCPPFPSYMSLVILSSSCYIRKLKTLQTLIWGMGICRDPHRNTWKWEEQLYQLSPPG